MVSSRAKESNSFVVLTWIFLVVDGLLLIALALLNWLVKRGERGTWWGSWPWLLKGMLAVCLVLAVVLEVMFVVSWALCPVVALAESWTISVSLNYVVSNALAMMNPLTQEVPTTNSGIMIVIIGSTWSMIIMTTSMGLISGLPIIGKLVRHMPQSGVGYILLTLLIIPAALIFLSGGMGILMASVEGWSIIDGLYFMASSLAGLSNPVTSATVLTSRGALIECVCLAVQMACMGAILGLCQNHPVTQRIIKFFGEDDFDARSAAPDPPSVPASPTSIIGLQGMAEGRRQEQGTEQFCVAQSTGVGGNTSKALQEVLDAIRSIEVDVEEAFKSLRRGGASAGVGG